MERSTLLLKDHWKFCIDPDGEGLSSHWEQNGIPGTQQISIPHTWNVQTETENYRGLAWYESEFFVPDVWKDQKLRIRFKGVYRDADVWLNGQKIGSHYNSGYTPFTLETFNALKYGQNNRLTVSVQNRFSADALPCRHSFDWADDGGIFRNVELILIGKNAIDSVRIYARPVLRATGRRQDVADAVFHAAVLLCCPDKSHDLSLSLEWELFRGCDGDLEPVEKHVIDAADSLSVQIQDILLKNVRLWHFDCPQLYTLKLCLKNGVTVEDTLETVFGFRDFHPEGNRFYFNGEPVRLSGTEWMPGSNPDFGMAESPEEIQKYLLLLKESNCVFTRFHWQQDDTVYDWCDRNGMLVQEEVPFWGREPKVPGVHQLEIFKQQAREMVCAHFNHPSIFAWGVGNELDGQAPETVEYVKNAVEYFKELDPTRAANYVSNSFFQGYSTDASVAGDIMMVNDYIGTWSGDLDQMGELEKIISANPKKALVPSEFGLCEPHFPGGDPARIRIFTRKMSAYRRFSSIAGTINFCLNDYRTQMGEDGEGMLRKRIHGSADLYGRPKPSYFAVQRECAPFFAEEFPSDDGRILLRLTVRDTLPCYTVKGYYFELRDRHGACVVKATLPTLTPGDAFSLELRLPTPGCHTGTLRRPNGNIALVLSFTRQNP